VTLLEGDRKGTYPQKFSSGTVEKKIKMELTQVHVENGHQNRDGGTSVVILTVS